MASLKRGSSQFHSPPGEQLCRSERRDVMNSRSSVHPLTVVKVRLAADPRIPDTRMVELQHRRIERHRQRSLLHQRRLHHHLVLDPKHRNENSPTPSAHLGNGHPRRDLETGNEFYGVEFVPTALCLVAVLRRRSTASGIVA